MRTGTPGFQPSRLREAREARGLSATALAEMLGITKVSISNYEKGKNTPGEDILRRLAEKLNVSVPYFLLPCSNMKSATVFFRSMASETKISRKRAMAKFSWLKLVVEHLSNFVEFPELRIPPISHYEEALQLTAHSIEQKANELRIFWGLGFGPISDVVCLLENNGIILSRLALDSAKLDGFSQLDSKRAYVVLAADKHSAARSRFDAAHELGHLVLHSSLPTEALENQEVFKKLEQQAHLFASAFLMPRTTFPIEIKNVSLASLLVLKRRWKLSLAAMLRRTRDLGLVNQAGYEKLMIELSIRRWRKVEPYDTEIEPENPRLLREALWALDDAGIIPRFQWPAEIPLSQRDLAELCGVEESIFEAERAPVRILEIGKDINRTA